MRRTAHAALGVAVSLSRNNALDTPGAENFQFRRGLRRAAYQLCDLESVDSVESKKYIGDNGNFGIRGFHLADARSRECASVSAPAAARFVLIQIQIMILLLLLFCLGLCLGEESAERGGAWRGAVAVVRRAPKIYLRTLLQSFGGCRILLPTGPETSRRLRVDAHEGHAKVPGPAC